MPIIKGTRASRLFRIGDGIIGKGLLVPVMSVVRCQFRPGGKWPINLWRFLSAFQRARIWIFSSKLPSKEGTGVHFNHNSISDGRSMRPASLYQRPNEIHKIHKRYRTLLVSLPKSTTRKRIIFRTHFTDYDLRKILERRERVAHNRTSASIIVIPQEIRFAFLLWLVMRSMQRRLICTRREGAFLSWI